MTQASPRSDPFDTLVPPRVPNFTAEAEDRGGYVHADRRGIRKDPQTPLYENDDDFLMKTVGYVPPDRMRARVLAHLRREQEEAFTLVRSRQAFFEKMVASVKLLMRPAI